MEEVHTPDLLAGLRNGAWLDAQEFPPLKWTVPGVIPEGMTLLVGPPKAGKSWLILSLALGLAAGGSVLGKLPVEPRPVLYLSLEDGHRRIKDRSRQLLGGAPTPAAFEYLTVVHPGATLATIEAWHDRHPGTEPAVFVDTLGKVMPPSLIGESAYARDYRVGAALKRLADDRPGSSLVIAHHDRKAESADFVDGVSGTNGLAGSADTIVLLARARHETSGLLKVTGRDVPEGEFAISFREGSRWELDGADLKAASQAAASLRAQIGLGDRASDVVAIVGRHPDGVRAQTVADELGIDAKTAGVYLKRMADTFRINRPSRGLYTPIESVVSVGTDEPDLFGSNTSNTINGGTDSDGWPLPQAVER